MVQTDKPLDRPNLPIEWLLFCLIPAPSFFVGWKHGAKDHLLIDTDSYNRVNRVEAILETGRWLHHVPRDNGGESIPIHWSHALDGWIVGFSRCLAPWVHSSDAVLAAGAVIGPLSVLALAWAAMSLVRRATGGNPDCRIPGDRQLWSVGPRGLPRVVARRRHRHVRSLDTAPLIEHHDIDTQSTY
jgi:hypothetical protein